MAVGSLESVSISPRRPIKQKASVFILIFLSGEEISVISDAVVRTPEVLCTTRPMPMPLPQLIGYTKSNQGHIAIGQC